LQTNEQVQQSSTTGNRMTVEIWSDVVCPWCYIGKRRFEAALEQFPQGKQVDVVWRSYQLDPSAPQQVEGSSAERLAKKYGVTVDEAKAMNQRVTDAAAEVGLAYQLDIARSGNTFDAHRLIHLAASKGLQDEAEERLMHGYFTEGLPVGDHEALVEAVAEIGVDADEAREVLASDAYADDVREDLQRGAAFGIRGVPFFVIDEAYGVSGAQPSEVFLSALQQAWTASHPLTMMHQDAGVEACDGPDCAVPFADNGTSE
jgi:predicted DsbA family dithiol-disulfide isomerase